jgi:hypothetical protein
VARANSHTPGNHKLCRRPEKKKLRTQCSLSNTKAIYAGSEMPSGQGGIPTDFIDCFHRLAGLGSDKDLPEPPRDPTEAEKIPRVEVGHNLLKQAFTVRFVHLKGLGGAEEASDRPDPGARGAD